MHVSSSFSQLLKYWQGPRDLYLGVWGSILGTLPTAAVYFATYEWCKGKLEARQCGQALTHVASASAGAVISAFVKTPSDTLKHQVQAYFFPNVWQVKLCSCYPIFS